MRAVSAAEDSQDFMDGPADGVEAVLDHQKVFALAQVSLTTPSHAACLSNHFHMFIDNQSGLLHWQICPSYAAHTCGHIYIAS